LGEFADTAGRSEFQGKFASDEIIGNPLQAFQLVKRLTINWGRIQNKMKNYDWKSKNIIKILSIFHSLCLKINNNNLNFKLKKKLLIVAFNRC
jgi:hypothetical protein